jgi:hypothetical protein
MIFIPKLGVITIEVLLRLLLQFHQTHVQGSSECDLYQYLGLPLQQYLQASFSRIGHGCLYILGRQLEKTQLEDRFTICCFKRRLAL